MYMKRNHITLPALIVAFVLLLQIGCQEQAKVPDEPIAALAAPEPAIGQEKVETVPEASQPTATALETQEKKSLTGPTIAFEKVVHDFGEVAPGTKQIGEFKFTNTGDSLLKVTEVKRCCGVVAKLAKEEFTPGESGALKVEYRSSTRASVMNKKLYVSSNDQVNPKITLSIKAKIVPKVAYEPQKVQIFLKGENAGCPEITLTSLDNQPFSIKAFKSSSDCITADVDSSVEATKFLLQPKVDFEKLQSSSSGAISISLTHPQCGIISIFFSVLPRFQSKPRSIIVFNAEPQKPMVRKISVLSNYSEDFEVESASSKNDCVKVLSQEKIANGYQLEVEITPPPADDTGKFTDELYVSLKGGEKLEITSYGHYSRQ
jgi:hypothetical protein